MRNIKTLFTFACRIVSGAKKHDHVTPLLNTLSWVPFNDQLYYRQSFMATPTDICMGKILAFRSGHSK